MRITKEMTLRPTLNGHMLRTIIAAGCKEINLPEQLGADNLMNAVRTLQNIIDMADDAKTETPVSS